jgi:hypothetical protein
MKFGGLKDEIEDNLKTLEAIFFLAQHLDDNRHRLETIRRNWPNLPRKEKLHLRDELRSEVKWAREEMGALASNKDYQKLYDKIREQEGYVYLQKIYIDREVFSNYRRVFRRWPYMRLHAAVIFDGKRNEDTGQVYEMEGPRLRDAREFLKRAKLAEKGIEDFRKRAKEDQLDILMFAQASILATLTFVEAYLNGLAYDSFQGHHDKLPLEDHDLLAEWDSDKKRQRFVDFREKVFKYPVIVGHLRGCKVDLSGCKPAHELVGLAKEFRDALVHPSPFVDVKTKEFKKFQIGASTNRKIAQEVFRLAVAYAEFVENAIGNDPKLSAPWLYNDANSVKEVSKNKLEGGETPSIDSRTSNRSRSIL